MPMVAPKFRPSHRIGTLLLLPDDPRSVSSSQSAAAACPTGAASNMAAARKRARARVRLRCAMRGLAGHRQIIETPTQTDAPFMRRKIFERHAAECIGRTLGVAEIEIAVADVGDDVRR